MKNKGTATLLAFFLGGVGGHKFYLDKPGMGVLYFLFCWTFIPVFIAMIEFIILLTMSEEAFNAKYNRGFIPAVAAPTIVHVQNTAVASAGSIASELRELRALKEDGTLTEEEFEVQKSRLLKSGT